MRLKKMAYEMAKKVFAVVDVVREGDETNREVQCKGELDATATGREAWRAAWHLGPGGHKHRATPGEKGLLVRIFEGVLLGMVYDENAPTDLDPGETAIFNSADAGKTSVVRCVSTRVEIGSGAGGLIIRKDRFTTWWDATPRANHLLHIHPGVMPGPVSTGVTTTDLGAVGTVENDEGHQVK